MFHIIWWYHHTTNLRSKCMCKSLLGNSKLLKILLQERNTFFSFSFLFIKILLHTIYFYQIFVFPQLLQDPPHPHALPTPCSFSLSLKNNIKQSPPQNRENKTKQKTVRQKTKNKTKSTHSSWNLLSHFNQTTKNFH